MKTALAVAGIALSSSVSLAGILSDGNFNSLAIGTAPDINSAAGAWQFPSNYVSNNLGESLSSNYTIAGTSSFDATGSGNSLHLKTQSEGASMHLVNLFGQTVAQSSNVIVTAGFDIWVTENGSLSSGGSFIIGGDHGGGGFSSTTDRGPQVTFGFNGVISSRDSQGVDHTLATGYQTNRWQTVRMTIDLTADRFDIFWGNLGGPLTQIGNDIGFRSPTQTTLDRFTWARFFDQTKFVDAYLDNVFVTIPAPGSLALVGAAAIVGIRRRR